MASSARFESIDVLDSDTVFNIMCLVSFEILQGLTKAAAVAILNRRLTVSN